MSKNEEVVKVFQSLNKKQKDVVDWLLDTQKVEGFCTASISKLIAGNKPTSKKGGKGQMRMDKNWEAKNEQLLNLLICYKDQLGKANDLSKLSEFSKSMELDKEAHPLPVAQLSSVNAKQGIVDKLTLYHNKDFYIYFYDENDTDVVITIGRAILSISQDNMAILSNIEGGVNTDYAGTVVLDGKQDYLVFNLKTKTNEKDLHMRFRIALGTVPKYAIGGYINTSNKLELGSLILEYQEGLTKNNMKALNLHPDTDLYKETNKHIRKFLKKRENNYIKMMSTPIFTDGDFERFYRHPRLRPNKEIIEQTDSSIFVSYITRNMSDTAIGGLMSLLHKMKTALQSIFECPIYFEGADHYKTKSDFKPEHVVIPLNIEHLNKADKLILYYHASGGSSALVELGWALAQRKSVVVFYKTGRDLPWLIKHSIHIPNVRLNLIEYKHEADLLHKITTEKPLFK